MSTPGALRVVEWNLAYFRRLWRTNVMNSFLQPLLYLLGLGIGVGTLVNRNSTSTDALAGLPYARFVAPGLLCTTALAVGYFESAWPVLGGFKWQRQYFAMASTPLGPIDIVLGHLLWVALRLLITTTAVMGALMLFPSVRDIGLVPGIVFATISGLAFAMVAMAFSSFQERDVAFVSVQRFLIIPLFLFGGAFFPLTQLPGWVQAIVKVAPLYHGTELCRAMVEGSLRASAVLTHVGYMALWIAAGFTVALRQFHRRLGQ